MKRYLALALVVGLGLVAGAAVAAEKTYADAAGDSGTAPDLTNIVVSDTNGFVAFRIDGTLVPSSSYEILIDSDRNRSTGKDGDELWLSVFQEGDGKTYWDAVRWDGSKWADANLQVRSQSFAGRHEIGFQAADAGITGSFDFIVVSVKMVADAIESIDRAPDSIVPWTYEMAAPAAPVAPAVAKPVLGKPTVKPARPLAGKPVTVSVPVGLGATGAPLTSGTASCTMRVAGKTVRARATVANGLAMCRLAVPGGTKGATAGVTVTVGSAGGSATRTFTFRIA